MSVITEGRTQAGNRCETNHGGITRAWKKRKRDEKKRVAQRAPSNPHARRVPTQTCVIARFCLVILSPRGYFKSFLTLLLTLPYSILPSSDQRNEYLISFLFFFFFEEYKRSWKDKFALYKFSILENSRKFLEVF